MGFKLRLATIFLIHVVAGPRADEIKVLFFHKVNGFVHSGTVASIGLFSDFAGARGMVVVPTVDSLKFNDDTLASYKAIVFINTNYRNGRLINDSQEDAFERYIQNGGGFVGVHSAVPLNGVWEETVWPWYAELFGGRFKSHPPFQLGEMIVENVSHISTRNMNTTMSLEDEWYHLQNSPRSKANILAVQNGASMNPPWKGEERPVSWYREFDGGRSWVTLVGHDERAFANRDFLEHLYGGILYAAGAIPGCTNSKYAEYKPGANWDDGSCTTGAPVTKSVFPHSLMAMSLGKGSLRIAGLQGRITVEVLSTKGEKLARRNCSTNATCKFDGLDGGVVLVKAGEAIRKALVK